MALLISLFVVAGTFAAEPVSPPASAEADYSAELPRVPPVEPADAVETFVVEPGFRIELVAAEPLVHDPVALAFDERGRLYVIEMCDYSEQEHDYLGAVRLLEDTNNDGRFDKSTVFADKFSWPTAIICFAGGVFVGAAPDIWFLKDTDGDGRADQRRKVFTGFGRDNVQGLLNSFQWGLDNRIHGAASSSGGQVRRAAAENKAKAISLRGRDFAFDPRTSELTPESGGAQHGLTFDDWGRKFVCSNSDHIQLVMFEDRYVARNPFLPAISPRLSIAADGPQAEVYRISPVEPWRIVRTRLRVAGAVPGPVEGGGRAAGYFTSATGVTIYRGDAWPPAYRGNAFIGDVGSNIVHRKVLSPRGVELLAERADAGREFVASRDIWFRPAQFANAPDGTLYIADVYREVIEHPLSLPPVIKRHLDLSSGRDRGRIYRIVPQGFKQPDPPRLDEASTLELVTNLESSNGWRRDTAARLLFERQDSTAAGPLKRLVATSASPLARMHALYALGGLGALDSKTLIQAVADEHPGVREHAVRLAERFAKSSAELASRLVAVADDPDVRVRYQLAFSLGELPLAERLPALAKLAKRDAGDRWMRLAMQSSLTDGAGQLLASLLCDETIRQSADHQPLLHDLALQVGRQGSEPEVLAVLSQLDALGDSTSGCGTACLLYLARGLSADRLTAIAREKKLIHVQRRIATATQMAQSTVADESAPIDDRVDALGMLDLAPTIDSQLLIELLAPRQPPPVQRAAVKALARVGDASIVGPLLAAWPALAPSLRSSVVELLFARPDRLPLVLDAVEDGRLSAGDLEASRVKFLRTHANAAIRSRAEKLFAQPAASRRSDVIEAYRGALTVSGDPGSGRKLFEKTCSGCHRVDGVGYELGPNLATIQNRGAETILVNVLDPNREVNPQYLNYLLATTDGRLLTGMLASETATSITLVRAENQRDTVLRADIDSLESSGMSLMPEGLEKDLSPQAMADLIAYLMAVR